MLFFSPSILSDSVNPWTAARQAFLFITIFQSLLKLMSIECMMPSNHFILCHPLVLLPSIFPSIRVFSNWAGSSDQVAKILALQLQYQFFQWISRTDFLYDGLVWSPCSLRNSQESSSAPQFKSINCLIKERKRKDTGTALLKPSLRRWRTCLCL